MYKSLVRVIPSYLLERSDPHRIPSTILSTYSFESQNTDLQSILWFLVYCHGSSNTICRSFRGSSNHGGQCSWNQDLDQLPCRMDHLCINKMRKYYNFVMMYHLIVWCCFHWQIANRSGWMLTMYLFIHVHRGKNLYKKLNIISIVLIIYRSFWDIKF